MASTSSIIRRALLYVPGSSQKMLEKSRSLNVDCVCYDLEDSVTPSEKPRARTAIRQFLSQPRHPGIKETAVRINSVGSGMALDDLTEVLQSPTLDTIVLPKTNSPSDLHFLTDVIRHTLPDRHPTSPTSPSPDYKPPLRILALIESARSLTHLPQICASTPLLAGLIFAAEDLALDLSLTRTPSLTEFLYARSHIVTCARAYNIPSVIDLVSTSYKPSAETPDPLEALERECVDGRNLGFNGKQIIHPSQIGTAQRAFMPSEGEVAWAVKVLRGEAEARRMGRGAWELEGRMVDEPVVGKARKVVERARGCGVDVDL